jgi:hypothetical protein
MIYGSKDKKNQAGYRSAYNKMDDMIGHKWRKKNWKEVSY